VKGKGKKVTKKKKGWPERYVGPSKIKKKTEQLEGGGARGNENEEKGE